jgi:hypothetical protein
LLRHLLAHREGAEGEWSARAEGWMRDAPKRASSPHGALGAKRERENGQASACLFQASVSWRPADPRQSSPASSRAS